MSKQADTTPVTPVFWKYQLIDEAKALGHLGQFFAWADGEDIQFLRNMLKAWLDRRNDEPTDLMSVAVSTTLFRSRQRDDAFEHAFMMLLERALEANTEILKDLAQRLPPRRGFVNRLNSRLRCRVKLNMRAMANTALDDQWPDVVPVWRDVDMEIANALGALRAEEEAELQKATPATKQKASSKRAAKTTSRASKGRKSKSA